MHSVQVSGEDGEPPVQTQLAVMDLQSEEQPVAPVTSPLSQTSFPTFLLSPQISEQTLGLVALVPVYPDGQVTVTVKGEVETNSGYVHEVEGITILVCPE